MRRRRAGFLGWPEKGEKVRSNWVRMGVEILEVRELLASLQVLGGGGISGVASLDQGVDRGFFPLGTPMAPPATLAREGSAHADIDAAPPWLVSGSSTWAVAVAVGLDGDSGVQRGSMHSSVGTSLGDDPGDFITLSVAPNTGTGDKVGDPASVALSVTGWDELGVNGDVELDYDAGNGPVVLLSKNTIPADASSHSATASFAVNVGQSFRIRMIADGSGTQGTTVGFASLHLTVSVLLSPQPDLAPTPLSWDTAHGGLNFGYVVNNEPLTTDASLALYWATGTTPDTIIDRNNPIFTYAITTPDQKTVGLHPQGTSPPIHVPDQNLSNYSTVLDTQPGPHQGITRAMDLLLLAEPGDKVSVVPLATIDFGPNFKSVLNDINANGTETETRVLNAALFVGVKNLANFLVAHNLITSFSFGSGLRTREQAHQWSTAYSIFTHPTSALLANLRRLPNGQDLDGIQWYSAAWEQGLRQNRQGQIVAADQSVLWARIRAHDAIYLVNPGAPSTQAAEGYLAGSSRRLPNTFSRGVSLHVMGSAIDASINWLSGAPFVNPAPPGQTERITNGQNHDKAANALIARYGLKRSVDSEGWHFELKNANGPL
jgi:hypothetical protein